MRLTELPPKITRLSILAVTMILVCPAFLAQELITVLPDGEFSPDLEQVEDYENGITIYDQYAVYLESPLIRKDEAGNPIKGKKEDYYSNGFLLHKGTYSDGVLKSFTNYYVNGSKERKFKGKKEGEGELICYFINGYYRSIMEYYDYKVVGSEVYYNNGILKKKIELDKESLLPKLIVTKNNENTVLTKLALLDEDSLIYEKEVFRVNGHKMEYGRMILDESTGDIVNDGPYYTFDKDGNFTSEVTYVQGNVEEIKFDERPDAEKEYFSYEAPESIAQSAEGQEEGQSGGEKSQELSGSIIPDEYLRFDKNQDDFISNKEVDFAVSEFFEDDSITLNQINGLVNYFFEQE